MRERSCAGISIGNLVRLGYPGTETRERFLAHELSSGNMALRERLFQFAIDEGVVKPDLGRIFGGIGEVEASKAGPIDGAQTHGARFA